MGGVPTAQHSAAQEPLPSREQKVVAGRPCALLDLLRIAWLSGLPSFTPRSACLEQEVWGQFSEHATCCVRVSVLRLR